MSVDPLKSRALPPAVGGEQARRHEASVEDRQSEVPPACGDSVELSAAAPQGTLSAERMQTVLRRLADGFYDGTDVRTEVARRLRPDIGNSTPVP
jgi:hypothetical protein